MSETNRLELKQLRRELRQLRDIIEIQRAISGATLYCDLGDPRKSEALYTKDATLDYSAIFGVDAAALEACVHWKNVRDIVRGLDAAQHQNTNFDIEIDGDTATATSLVTGTLRIQDRMAISGSVYFHKLVREVEGWKIKHQVYRVSYLDGEDMTELVASASDRATTMIGAFDGKEDC